MRTISLCRRFAVLVTATAACLSVPAASSAALTPVARDVGALVGFRTATPSWDVRPWDWNGDGWTDVFFSHHGRPGQLYRNIHPHGVFARYSMIAKFKDTIHNWDDRHGCAWGDVNQDARPDLICMKGAHRGTVLKWNELWIQKRDGSFVDRAAAYGVEDIYGRGRYAAFIDINHDRWPDLFLGNDSPRADGHLSPNRTYVNEGGTSFHQVFMGVTKEEATHCVQVVDMNHDAWDDLAVCSEQGLLLYVREGSRFVERRADMGLPGLQPSKVVFADLDGDGWEEFITVGTGWLRIYPSDGAGSFGDPWMYPLTRGRNLAVGDADGSGALDIYVVQSCIDSVNVRDVLLLNGGDGTTWTPVAGMPRNVPGCGDTAASLDFDRDGLDDFVVQNGAFIRTGVLRGPDQLLTLGDWGN